jgi:hypothetical protein
MLASFHSPGVHIITAGMISTSRGITRDGISPRPVQRQEGGHQGRGGAEDAGDAVDAEEAEATKGTEVIEDVAEVEDAVAVRKRVRIQGYG